MSLLALFLLLTGLNLSSCIGDELPNIEVDIVNVTSTQDGIVRTTIQENGVTVFVDKNVVDLKNLNLAFDISEGATSTFVTPKQTPVNDNVIDPENYTVIQGDVVDYTEVRYLEVISEDKVWKKVWTILVQPVTTQFPTKYDFDSWKTPDGTQYKIPFETVIEDGKTQELNMWATTNNSVAILLQYVYGEYLNYTHFGACPTEDTPSGTGSALKLTTMDIEWADPRKPIVSGCMFLGEFDGTDLDPITGTHFGMPFNKKPTTFKFKYKYDPQTIKGGTDLDTGLIEAVLYKTSEKVPYLTGYTIKDKSFSNIVGYAELNPNKKTDGYVSVELPFTYTQSVNTEDLENWKYSLAIYFASSLHGDEYIGAGGTVLQIDEVEVVCE